MSRKASASPGCFLKGGEENKRKGLPHYSNSRSPLRGSASGGTLREDRVRGHRLVQSFDQRDRRCLTGLDQGGVFLLRHGEELGLLLGRHPQQRGQRGQVLALALRHVLGQVVEVDSGEDRRPVLCPELLIIRRSKRVISDTESLVRGRKEHIG